MEGTEFFQYARLHVEDLVRERNIPEAYKFRTDLTTSIWNILQNNRSKTVKAISKDLPLIVPGDTPRLHENLQYHIQQMSNSTLLDQKTLENQETASYKMPTWIRDIMNPGKKMTFAMKASSNFSEILIAKKGDELPKDVQIKFTNALTYQTSVNLKIYIGNALQNSMNRLIGELKLTDIPQVSLQTGRYEANFNLNAYGDLNASLIDIGTDVKHEIQIPSSSILLEGIDNENQQLRETVELATDEYRENMKMDLEIMYARVKRSTEKMKMSAKRRTVIQNKLREVEDLLNNEGNIMKYYQKKEDLRCFYSKLVKTAYGNNREEIPLLGET